MVRPKKHLGQHFLTDRNIASKIVGSLGNETTHVVEIGPGTGILTESLIERFNDQAYMLEIDSESVSYLQTRFPQLKEHIIQADFLNFDLTTLFEHHISIIGNFPYNISSQILFRILTYRNLVGQVVGMFQREVARRVASPPGSKSYGILSVLVQAFYKVEYLFTVNENVFNPPPKVKSAVIKMVRNDIEKLNCNEELFFSVVKTAFNQRRKMLRNALSIFNFHPDDRLDELLSKRAEQLTVQQFELITNCIK